MNANASTRPSKTMVTKRAPEQIQRRRLSQEVMDRLISLIEDDGLTAGDQLPSERDLMDRYGVGRPAVREALQNMANVGLVTLTQGERARVAAPSFSNLMQAVSLTTSGILRTSKEGLTDLKEARLLFESQMVRLAAERATNADLERLEQRFRDHSAAQADLADFLRHDMLFHREIAAITNNSIFPNLSEALMGWLSEFHRHLVSVPGAEQLTLSEHESILVAVKARDPDAAETAMRNHLTRANKLYQHIEAVSRKAT
ncbi:transcriptional regulator NanR [Bauldia litoralis]|uniref:transcriptional regulator NanR n=1 Tax=Bauldia litoralis TaxID=665467 RepID=UPI0032651019